MHPDLQKVQHGPAIFSKVMLNLPLRWSQKHRSLLDFAPPTNVPHDQKKGSAQRSVLELGDGGQARSHRTPKPPGGTPNKTPFSLEKPRGEIKVPKKKPSPQRQEQKQQNQPNSQTSNDPSLTSENL